MGDNTSKQNLETIVEAIRHLEGDHLFSEESGPHQVKWGYYYSEVKDFKERRLINLWGYMFGINDFPLKIIYLPHFNGKKSLKAVSLRANS